MGYGKSVLIALDQLVNALCGGWPDETLSSRAWRWHLTGVRSWPLRLLDSIARFFGDKDHCRESYESERQGGSYHRKSGRSVNPVTSTNKEANGRKSCPDGRRWCALDT